MLPEAISILIEILKIIIFSTSKTVTFIFFKLIELYFLITSENNAVSPVEIFITLLILFILAIVLLRFFISSIKTLLLFLFALGLIALIIFSIHIMLQL